MNNNALSKPWYFLSSIIPYFFSVILDKVISLYFPDSFIEKVLNYSVTLKIILPVLLCIAILGLCIWFYIKNLINSINEHLTPLEFEELNNSLNKLVSDYEYVESVQAYQYWYKNDNDSKYIKVSYLAGAADERIDINSIMQTYFYLPYSIAKKVRGISEQYDNYLRAVDPVEKYNYKVSYKKMGTDLCDLLLKSLNSIKTVNEIGKYHCELYQCLVRIFSLISDKPVEKMLKDDDVEEELIKRRKTGILGSIIIHDSYVFKNHSSITKSNRIYCAFPHNKSTILLASLNGDLFDGENNTDILDYCKQIQNTINEM